MHINKILLIILDPVSVGTRFTLMTNHTKNLHTFREMSLLSNTAIKFCTKGSFTS